MLMNETRRAGAPLTLRTLERSASKRLSSWPRSSRQCLSSASGPRSPTWMDAPPELAKPKGAAERASSRPASVSSIASISYRASSLPGSVRQSVVSEVWPQRRNMPGLRVAHCRTPAHSSSAWLGSRRMPAVASMAPLPALTALPRRPDSVSRADVKEATDMSAVTVFNLSACNEPEITRLGSSTGAAPSSAWTRYTFMPLEPQSRK
mmetsp:Transcript_11961/g.34961  ORF Transcript_11961/g.34961 Transcript_11961/m.34961 type:complete len:207 (+) Transcript_11961:791-1411(+)